VVGHRLVGSIFSTTRAFHVVVICHVQEMYVLGHPKRRKRQGHTGGRNYSRSDGERGARLNRRFAFVLNQTPPRGCRLSEAATSLNSLGVLVLPYVGQPNDHQDALGAGRGVTAFAQEGRASEEFVSCGAGSCRGVVRLS
jgi:hypothetical protein